MKGPRPGQEATGHHARIAKLKAERDAARLNALEAAFDQHMIWLRWLGEVAPDLLRRSDLPTLRSASSALAATRRVLP
jgi:hypothetical protein